MWVQSLRLGFDPWEGKIPWRRAWQSTLVVLPDKSHGQRGLAGCSPWGHKELDMTEHTHMPCPSRKGMNTPEGDSEMGGLHCHCSFRGHRPRGQSCLLLGFRGPGCCHWNLRNQLPPGALEAGPPARGSGAELPARTVGATRLPA